MSFEEFNLPSQHYRGTRYVRQITDSEIRELKRVVDTTRCDFPQYLTVYRRIGSESMIGRIYDASLETETETIVFAFKVIRGINECHEFGIWNYLTDFGTSPDTSKFLRSVACFDCNKIVLNGIMVSGNVVLMELAIGDLMQVIETMPITESELLGYVRNIVDSCFVMARKGVLHGDLHLGNIFVVPRQHGLVAVPGDFGESITTDVTETLAVSNFNPVYNHLMPIVKTRYPKVAETMTKIKSKLTELSGLDPFDEIESPEDLSDAEADALIMRSLNNQQEEINKMF